MKQLLCTSRAKTPKHQKTVNSIRLGRLGGLAVGFQACRVGSFCKNFQIPRSFFTKLANPRYSLDTLAISGKNPYPKKLRESY